MNNVQLHPSLAPLDGGLNFRDLGGNKGVDGRLVKRGRLFRSGALDQLTQKDCQYLSKLPVTNILDYRSSGEIQQRPDILWSGANYTHTSTSLRKSGVVVNIDQLNNQILNELDSREFMLGIYRDLPFDNLGYQQLVVLLERMEEGGIVQHCAVGKDRTGMGSALVLLALGADRETVLEDYLLSGVTLSSYFQHMLKDVSHKLSEQNIKKLSYVLSVKEEFMATSLDAIADRYGSTGRWLEEEYGLDRNQRERLQQHYLED